MELTLNSSLRVNNPHAKFHYFAKPCFIPKPSIVRLPNHDLLSSSNTIASLKACQTTWAAPAALKNSITPVAAGKPKRLEASSDDDEEYADNSSDVDSDASDDNNDDVDSAASVEYETSKFDPGHSSYGNCTTFVEKTFVEKLSTLIGDDCGLIRLRVQVMVKWLLMLSRIPRIMKVTCLSKESQMLLINLADEVTQEDALEIKKIMNKVDGVKAVETFLKEKCKSDPDMAKMLELFDLSCTSKGISNIVAALMMKEAVEMIIMPAMRYLLDGICCLARNFARVPIGRSRDLGEPAMGIEIAKFVCRLDEAQRNISQVEIIRTLDDASRLIEIFDIGGDDLKGIAKEFVRSLGITPNPQNEQGKRDGYVDAILHSIIRFNCILAEFDSEIKGYISSLLEIFKPRQVLDQEANRSTAKTWSQRIKTTYFENSEYNTGIANRGLYNLIGKFPHLLAKKDFRADDPFLRSMVLSLEHSLSCPKTT